jgi:hypothetical protein
MNARRATRVLPVLATIVMSAKIVAIEESAMIVVIVGHVPIRMIAVPAAIAKAIIVAPAHTVKMTITALVRIALSVVLVSLAHWDSDHVSRWKVAPDAAHALVVLAVSASRDRLLAAPVAQERASQMCRGRSQNLKHRNLRSRPSQNVRRYHHHHHLCQHQNRSLRLRIAI